jgi:hypothetical protein
MKKDDKQPQPATPRKLRVSKQTLKNLKVRTGVRAGNGGGIGSSACVPK